MPHLASAAFFCGFRIFDVFLIILLTNILNKNILGVWLAVANIYYAMLTRVTGG